MSQQTNRVLPELIISNKHTLRFFQTLHKKVHSVLSTNADGCQFNGCQYQLQIKLVHHLLDNLRPDQKYSQNKMRYIFILGFCFRSKFLYTISACDRDQGLARRWLTQMPTLVFFLGHIHTAVATFCVDHVFHQP